MNGAANRCLKPIYQPWSVNSHRQFLPGLTMGKMTAPNLSSAQSWMTYAELPYIIEYQFLYNRSH